MSSHAVAFVRGLDRPGGRSAPRGPGRQSALPDRARGRARRTRYRAAVNVNSQESPSELLYLVVDDFRHPIIDRARRRTRSGWHAAAAAPGGPDLDSSAATSSTRARCGRCPRRRRPRQRPRRPARPPRAARDRRLATRSCYVFGQRWGPETAPRQDLRLRAGQRRPRRPHEPGQQRARSAATTACGRTAGCSSTSRPTSLGRHLPRLPEPGVAHRRRHRPRARRHPDPRPAPDRVPACGSWRPWSTRSARPPNARPSRSQRLAGSRST